jgi:hypothetical protein
MTYVLGTLTQANGLGAVPQTVAGAVQGAGLPFETVFRTAAKALIAATPDIPDRKVRNAIRYGDPEISVERANARALKGEYIQPYKAFRDAAASAMGALGYKEGAGFRNMRTQALDAYMNSLIQSVRAELRATGLVVSSKQDSSDKLKKESDDTPADNTLLYVAGAAAVALVAFGAMRRKA